MSIGGLCRSRQETRRLLEAEGSVQSDVISIPLDETAPV